MKSTIRMLHWLRLLMLSAGLAAGPCGSLPESWRRWHHRIIRSKILQKRIHETHHIINLIMKIRLQILRWLSLHTLSANKAEQLQVIAYTSRFRRRRTSVLPFQTISIKSNQKTNKTNHIINLIP
jgi:hypothetical protein